MDDPLVNEPARISGYRLAAEYAASRLLWDLDYRAWVSRRRLARVVDRYAGQRCLILCNGPSLNHVDFAAVARSGVYTFGLNKVNLLFDRTDFRPAAIVAVNQLVMQQNADFYNSTTIPLFLGKNCRRYIGLRPNITYLHTTPVMRFARDCRGSVSIGFTVTAVALQLAFHMGFRSVGLVGCDHSFATKGPPDATVKSGEKDDSHFDPRYFSQGALWDLPNLPGSEYFYDLAERTYRAFGGKVVNCTNGGKLEIFQRMALDEFLGR